MQSSLKNGRRSLILKSSILIAAILGAIAYAGLSTVIVAKSGATESFTPTPAVGVGAGALFQSRCAKCHGTDGRGDTPSGRALGAPDFTDGNWRGNHSAAERREVISAGKKGMPAFGKKLSRQQIASLASFIDSFR